MMSTTSIGDQSEVDNFRYCSHVSLSCDIPKTCRLFYENTNKVPNKYWRPVVSGKLQVLYLYLLPMLFVY